MKIKVMIVFLFVVSKISAQEVDTLRIRSIENLKSNMKVDSLLPRIDIDSRNTFRTLPYDGRTFNMNLNGRNRNNNNNILSAELGYLLLPVIHKAFGIVERSKSSSLAIAPTIGLNNYGLGMAYTF